MKDKSQKFILWGAWFTSNKIVNLVRVFLTKYVDANIFYTVKTKNDFINKGINGKTYMLQIIPLMLKTMQNHFKKVGQNNFCWDFEC